MGPYCVFDVGNLFFRFPFYAQKAEGFGFPFVLELGGVKIIVASAKRHQLAMAAGFHHLTLVNDQDPVAGANGGKLWCGF